jgi:hypothetical protein
MRVLGGICLVLLLCCTGSLALDVKTQSDPEAQLESYETYAWKKGQQSGINEHRQAEVDRWIRSAVSAELAAKEMREVTEDPDFFVTYYATTDVYSKLWKEHSAGGASFGWNAFRGQPDTQGVLLIDVIDASTDEVVWRAHCSDTVKRGSSKTDKKIRKAARLAFKDYPPKAAASE